MRLSADIDAGRGYRCAERCYPHGPNAQRKRGQARQDFFSRIWNDKKITAHHGIIPTKQPFDLSKLSTEELKVYQLIRQHYLAQFLPLHEVDVTEATFNIGGQLFRTRGKVEAVAGWKALFQHDLSEAKEELTDTDDVRLPALVIGETVAVAGAELKTLQTKPRDISLTGH